MSYRVVVWGPGNVGLPAIRSVLCHPELELAGVIVHSPQKEGRDAGQLAGTAHTGVTATRDVQAVLGSKPDALVYAVNSDFRPAEAIEECCSALASGINVVTAGQYGLLHPASARPELRERFEAACRAGNSSFFSNGIDPGFAIDLLPLVLSEADGATALPEQRPVFSQLMQGWGNVRREAVPLFSVTDGSRRLIASQEDPPRFELYDRARDPKEQNDLYPEDGAKAAELKGLLEAYQREANPPWGQAPSAVEIEELRLNQLRALGYSIER